MTSQAHLLLPSCLSHTGSKGSTFYLHSAGIMIAGPVGFVEGSHQLIRFLSRGKFGTPLRLYINGDAKLMAEVAWVGRKFRCFWIQNPYSGSYFNKNPFFIHPPKNKKEKQDQSHSKGKR